MCRLFGFRSNQPSRVHASLVAEKNSLLQQSREHQDGWGIAYYAGSPSPEVAHGLGPAHSDPEFERVSSLVSSRAVLAHVRRGTVGEVALRNTHPFLHGCWAFAHNGTVRNFDRHRERIERLIAPELVGRIQGETDSERCFYLFLTELGGERSGPDEVAGALARTMRTVSGLTDHDGGDEPPSALNFMVTDGTLLIATRRHRTLLFSTSGGPRDDGQRIAQLVIASEELSSETDWQEVPEHGLIGVGGDMALRRWTLDDGSMGLGPGLVDPPRQDPPPISTEELRQADPRPVIVETNSAAAFARGHIPGAIHIPRARVQELAPSLIPDLGAAIVTYCKAPT